MKKLIIFLVVLTTLFCGCVQRENVSNHSSQTEADSETNFDSNEKAPSNNEELYRLVIKSYETGEFGDLYEYMGEELKNLMSSDDAIFMFSSLYDLGGRLITSEYTVSQNDEGDCYRAKMSFENITADLALTLKSTKIVGFIRNVRFDKTFETEFEGVREKRFVIENDGYRLNAAYTYLADGKTHPAVLLIPGSGVSDYNETIGILTPFADIAAALAKQGINSLRIDKRTVNYGDDFAIEDGIEEEYLSDFSAALDYLVSQENTSAVYLLGHSLGGQIASRMASDRNDIDGIILLNSTARHMADVLANQYTAIDRLNEASYRLYADSAKKSSYDTAAGLRYYGVSDYYWASYNSLDVIEYTNKLQIPILIINSLADKQLFNADIELWRESFGESENVEIYVDEEIGHFGYVFDEDAATAIYHITDISSSLSERIGSFITEKTK